MQTDFRTEYAAALALVQAEHPVNSTDLPSFEELTNAIADAIEGEDSCFKGFDAFYHWWDVLLGYDALDSDEYPEDHKQLLEVAFRALVADGVLHVDPSKERSQ